jgi:hypothetical protein
LGFLTKTFIQIFSFIFSQNFWEGWSPTALMDKMPLNLTDTEVHVMLTDIIIGTTPHTVSYSVVGKYYQQ